MEKPVNLRGHLHHLAETGGDPHDLLAGTGITYEAIDTLKPIPVDVIATLFDVLASRTPDDFAIRCGRATRFQNMGILGFRLLNSGTVRELLDVWNKYSIVIGYPLESRLIVADQRWTLEFRPRYRLTPRALRFCMEATIAGSLPSVREMSGHDIRPSGYAFPFPRPADIACYAPLMPTPLVFEADAGSITGKIGDLARRLVNIDADSMSLSDEYCRRALARITHIETTSQRIRTILASSRGRMPTAREMAALLRLSLRTLQRQLADEGQGYHRVVEVYRQEQGQALLQQGADTKTIAYSLGFEDIGSFRRAFRQWTGQTPAEWRSTSSALAWRSDPAGYVGGTTPF